MLGVPFFFFFFFFFFKKKILFVSPLLVWDQLKSGPLLLFRKSDFKDERKQWNFGREKMRQKGLE
jgi:hypothetical protein